MNPAENILYLYFTKPVTGKTYQWFAVLPFASLWSHRPVFWQCSHGGVAHRLSSVFIDMTESRTLIKPAMMQESMLHKIFVHWGHQAHKVIPGEARKDSSSSRKAQVYSMSQTFLQWDYIGCFSSRSWTLDIYSIYPNPRQLFSRYCNPSIKWFVLDSRASVSKKMGMGWLRYDGGREWEGGTIHSEGVRHPAFFLFQKLTLLRIHTPLSSTFSDFCAGRRARKTRCAPRQWWGD